MQSVLVINLKVVNSCTIILRNYHEGYQT